MFFVTPFPVYDRVMDRLGGEANVATAERRHSKRKISAFHIENMGQLCKIVGHG